jgi:hypothetical protein
MRYIIDSYAWIEYFMGTERCREVKEVVPQNGCLAYAIHPKYQGSIPSRLKCLARGNMRGLRF